jgi:hypothetical protein
LLVGGRFSHEEEKVGAVVSDETLMGREFIVSGQNLGKYPIGLRRRAVDF